MNLTEFRMRAMNDEVQMIEDFNFFEQKVASFKKDLYLSPYAKINEILAKQAIQDKLNKLNPDTIESHASVNDKTISVWSDYVLELLELDRRYQDVVYSFCVSIDNCVRYLVSYTDELAEFGFSLPQIMVKVRDLGTFHWLNKQSKAQLLGCI